MFLRWLAAVVVLPCNALVVIPGLLLLAFRGGPLVHVWAAWGSGRCLTALVLAALGLGLAFWSAGLFVRYGEGTAAPWDPPKKFVVKGPYLYVRNPMIISVFIMQLAETIFTRSEPVCGWLVGFVMLNLFYIPLSEEMGLEARFGDEYRRYKAAVPRWLPRIE